MDIHRLNKFNPYFTLLKLINSKRSTQLNIKYSTRKLLEKKISGRKASGI